MRQRAAGNQETGDGRDKDWSDCELANGELFIKVNTARGYKTPLEDYGL